MKKNYLLIILLVILLLAVGAYLIFNQEDNVVTKTVKKSGSKLSGDIYLEPASASYKVGETFNVDIKVNTGKKKLDGVDVRFIKYDPALLEVQDSDVQAEGTQVKPGSIFQMYLGNVVDKEKGTIALSGIVNPGESEGYSGTGVFATISFKVLKEGKANISFDFKADDTTDTNMVEHQTAKDICRKAEGAQFTLVSS